MGNKRNYQLDILKGLAIILVVWGHLIENDNILFRYINIIHLPVFFFISGFLAYDSINKHKISDILSKKVFRLLIPFFSWSAVAVLASVVMGAILNSNTIYSIKVKFLHTFVYAESMWFLLVLFWCFGLLLVLEKLKNRKIVVVILLLTIYLVIPNDIFKIGKFKTVFPLFILGFMVNKFIGNKEVWLNKIKKYRLIGLLIFILGLLLVYDKEIFIRFYEFDIKLLSFDIVWFTYFWFMQMLAVYLAFAYVGTLFVEGKKVSKGVIVAGAYTLDIYVLHMFFVEYCSFVPKTVLKIEFLHQIYLFLYSIVIVGICVFISKYFLHKIKLYRIIMLGDCSKK